MDRRRDIPPEDRYGGGGGQSYRPGIARRTPPPRRERDDTYGARSPLGRPYDSRGPRGLVQEEETHIVRDHARLHETTFSDETSAMTDHGTLAEALLDFEIALLPYAQDRRFEDRLDENEVHDDTTHDHRARTDDLPRHARAIATTLADHEAQFQELRQTSAWIGSERDQKEQTPSPRTSEYRAAATPEQKRMESPKRDKDGDVGMANTQETMKPRQDAPAPERAPPSGPSERPFVPPAGPRGDVPNRGGFSARGRGYGDYPVPGRSSITATFRGGRGGAPYARGPSYERESSLAAPVAPAASRNFLAPVPRPAAVRTASTTSQFDSASYEAPRAPAVSIQSDTYRRPPAGPSAAPTGPSSDRTSRPVSDGVHPALRDLPEVILNGKRLPPIADKSRLVKLEEEAERLRKMIQEKDARKRRGLREWDRLVREGESAAYRCEVAEGSVRAFDGDGERAGAAF